MRASSDQVTSASEQVAASGQSLASGSSEQASSLEEISSRLEEILGSANLINSHKVMRQRLKSRHQLEKSCPLKLRK